MRLLLPIIALSATLPFAVPEAAIRLTVTDASGGICSVIRKFTIAEKHFMAAGNGSFLHVYEGDWDRPRLQAKIYLGGVLKDIEFSGKYAFAVTHLGLAVLDFSNPPSPSIRSFLPGRNLNRVSESAGYLYIQGVNTLVTVDVREPEQPRFLGSYGGPLAWGTDAVHVQGLHAFVFEHNDLTYPGTSPIIRVFQVEDKTAFKHVVSIPLNESGAYGFGTPRFTMSGSRGVVTGWEKIQVWDFSNPALPRRLAERSLGNVHNTLLQPDMLVASLWNPSVRKKDSLVLFDFPQPDSIRMSSVAYSPDREIAVDVDGATEGIAYMAESDSIRFLDLSAGMPGRLRGALPKSPALAGLAASGRRLAATWSDNQANWANHLAWADIPASGAPIFRRIGLDTGVAIIPPGVVMSGNRIYAGNKARDLITVDFPEDGGAPVARMFPLNSGFKSFSVTGTIGYFLQGGLLVADLSGSGAPRHLGYVEITGDVSGMAKIGNRIYVGNGHKGIAILDVSNPKAPRLERQHPFREQMADMRISGSLAYVLDGSRHLQILDLANPLEPAFLSSTPVLPGRHSDMLVKGSRLYLVNEDSSKIQILDVFNPSKPIDLGFSDLPWWPSTLVSVDSSFYLAAGSAGVLVMRETAAPLPIGPGNRAPRAGTGAGFGLPFVGRNGKWEYRQDGKKRSLMGREIN